MRTLTLFLLLAAPLAAQPNGLSLLSLGRVAALQLPSTPPTPLTPYASETWVGFGSDLAWTDGGDGLPNAIIDDDYLTAPPGGSAEALRLSTAAATGYRYYTTTSYAKTEVRFPFRIDARSGTPVVLTLRNGVTTLGTLFLTSGNRLRVSASGGTSNDSTTVLPTGTDLWLWVEYHQGSGSNAQMRAGWSYTNRKPTIITTGAFSCQSVNGTRTTQPTRLYVQTDTAQTLDLIVGALDLAQIP